MVMRKYQERRLSMDVLARLVQYKDGDATRLGSSSYCGRGQHRFTGNTCCALRSFFKGLNGEVPHVRVEIWSSREALGREHGRRFPPESRENKKLRHGGRERRLHADINRNKCTARMTPAALFGD